MAGTRIIKSALAAILAFSPLGSGCSVHTQNKSNETGVFIIQSENKVRMYHSRNIRRLELFDHNNHQINLQHNVETSLLFDRKSVCEYFEAPALQDGLYKVILTNENNKKHQTDFIVRNHRLSPNPSFFSTSKNNWYHIQY